MKLMHYTDKPLGELRVIEQREYAMKPIGLWLSDDDDENNWPAWCESEDFGLDRFTHAYEVQLVDDANVLTLSTENDIGAFTVRYTAEVDWDHVHMFMDWQSVARKYDGLIITPYQWNCRLSLMWYYGWDCASGCIWHPRAIASITLRRP